MSEDPSDAAAAAPPPPAAAPRRWWLAALLSLAVCGLGQVYSGQPRKGVLLYLLQWPLVLLASRAMVSPVPFSLAVLLLLLALLLRAFAIGDAIVAAIGEGIAVPRRLPYDRWYVYLVALIVLFPFSNWGLERAIHSQAEEFYIPSAAMEDTLIPGDHLYVRPWGSRGAPRHGEIVVFRSVENPRAMVVKRCVALPGEVVRIVDKKLYVDGTPVDDSAYAVHKDPGHPRASDPSLLSARDNFGPLTVPAGEFFALGDNRDNSWDSRFYGPVPQSNIMAGGVMRIYLFHDAAGHWRFDRIGALIE